MAMPAGICKRNEVRGEVWEMAKSTKDRRRGQNGDADRRQPSSVAGDLTMASSFNGGREGTAPCERGSAGERGVGRKQMGDRGGFERKARALYRFTGSGCTVHMSNGIGRRGRRFWAAL
jgi:hypothetical protein